MDQKLNIPKIILNIYIFLPIMQEYEFEYGGLLGNISLKNMNAISTYLICIIKGCLLFLHCHEIQSNQQPINQSSTKQQKRSQLDCIISEVLPSEEHQFNIPANEGSPRIRRRDLGLWWQKQFQAHKFVLSTSSPIFTKSLRESKLPHPLKRGGQAPYFLNSAQLARLQKIGGLPNSTSEWIEGSQSLTL